MARERAVDGWRELIEIVQEGEIQRARSQRPILPVSALMPPPLGRPSSSRPTSLTRVRSARADRPDGTWTRQMSNLLPSTAKEATAIPEAFLRNTVYSVQECLQAADEAHGMGYPVVALIRTHLSYLLFILRVLFTCLFFFLFFVVVLSFFFEFLVCSSLPF